MAKKRSLRPNTAIYGPKSSLFKCNITWSYWKTIYFTGARWSKSYGT